MQFRERSVGADGCCPDAYDGSQIKVKDTQGRWYRVDISITQNTSMNDRALVGEDTRDRSHEDFANVIGYDDLLNNCEATTFRVLEWLRPPTATGVAQWDVVGAFLLEGFLELRELFLQRVRTARPFVRPSGSTKFD